MLHTHTHIPSDKLNNGTLYAPQFEEDFLPKGKKRPHYYRYSNEIFYEYKMFFNWSYAISSIYQWYTPVVGNTRNGKRHTPRTGPALQDSCIRSNVTFTPILFGRVPDHFNAFFNLKSASEKDAKNVTPPSTGQLEKRTTSCTTDAVEHLTLAKMATTYIYLRFKSLTEPCVP